MQIGGVAARRAPGAAPRQVNKVAATDLASPPGECVICARPTSEQQHTARRMISRGGGISAAARINGVPDGPAEHGAQNERRAKPNKFD